MRNFMLGLNNLLIDSSRGVDRVVVAMLVAAGVAGVARSLDGVSTCLGLSLVLLSLRRHNDD